LFSENLLWDTAIYLVRRYSRKTLTEMGRYFGTNNYSTASSAVERIKGRRKIDRTLRKHFDRIMSQVNKPPKQTCPLVLLQFIEILHKAREVDILLAQDGFKAVLEWVAGSVVSSIVPQGITGQKAPHDRGDRHKPIPPPYQCP